MFHENDEICEFFNVQKLLFHEQNYYFAKKITNLRRKSRVKVQKIGVKFQKSGVKVHNFELSCGRGRRGH